MHGFSTADGFLDVKEGLDEMIKYLANEPSAGLFFVQKHAQSSMPYLLAVKDEVVEKINEVSLQTEDIEDSICVVRSMPECGLPIIDEMIKGINRSLHIISTSQPKRGLIQKPSPSWGSQVERSERNMPPPQDNDNESSEQHNRKGRLNYFSAVFSSARQKAVGFRWSSQSSGLTQNHEGEHNASSYITKPSASSYITKQLAADTTILPAIPNADADADEVPLSRNRIDNKLDDPRLIVSSPVHDMSSVLDNYDKFQSDREAKLEEWLQESETSS